MFDKRDPTYEPGRQLHSAISLAVQEDTIQKAQSWVKNGLIEMEIHPAEQKRLVAALTQQLDHILGSQENDNTRTLTLHLFSAGSQRPASPGWGFFMINNPANAPQGVLEIYIYREPPV